MSHPYADVVVVNANHLALDLSVLMRAEPEASQREFFGGNLKSGYLYLYSNPKYPEFVFECVMSVDGDAIAAVYRGHPIFASLGEVTKARDRLCDLISAEVGLSVEGVGVDDKARGRTLGLRDLSTGQLVDMLRERTGGKVIAVTDNHVALETGNADVSDLMKH